MILSYESLVGAIGKVRSIASDGKAAPAVLLKFATGEVKVCYSDGRNSIQERIEGQAEENDSEAHIVVRLDRMTELLDLCSPGTNLKTAPLQVSFDNIDGFSIATRKYYEYVGEDEEVQQRDVSIINKTIKYYKVADELRYELLSRMDYDSIFNSDNWDTWKTDYLRTILMKVSKNDPKLCYISSKSKSTFAVNGDKVSLTYMDIKETEDFTITQGFTASSKVAKYMCGILGNIADKNVLVSRVGDTTDYCKIISEDGNVGIQFKMEEAGKFDKITLDRYRGAEFNGYQVVFNRYALMDFIKGVMASDNEDEAVSKFSITEDGLALETKRGNATTSKTGLSIIAESYVDAIGDIDTKEFTLNFKIINTLVSNCNEQFLVLDLVSMPSGTLIRMTDSCGKDGDGNIVANTYHYMAAK